MSWPIWLGGLPPSVYHDLYRWARKQLNPWSFLEPEDSIERGMPCGSVFACRQLPPFYSFVYTYRDPLTGLETAPLWPPFSADQCVAWEKNRMYLYGEWPPAWRSWPPRAPVDWNDDGGHDA